MPRPYTEKRKTANKKWDTKNLDRISVALPKGYKDRIKEHAENRGEKMSSFIKRAITEQIDRDNHE